MGTVFRIWNEVNSKSYIGATYRPFEEIEWILSPRTGRAPTEIYDDLLKYPVDSWEWEILDNDDESGGEGSLNDLKKKYTERYDSVKNGYNKVKGGAKKKFRKTDFDQLIAPSGLNDKIYQAITKYQSEHKKSDERRRKVGFVQINNRSIAVRLEDVVGLEISDEGAIGWVLKIYLRGSGEPVKIMDDQLILNNIYEVLLSYLGDVEYLNIP